MFDLEIQLMKLKHSINSFGRKGKFLGGFIFLLLFIGLYALIPNQSCLRLLTSGNREVYANLSILLNSDPLKVHIIDVGQGDATLIQYKSFNILIDCGPLESSGKLISYLKAVGAQKIDAMILTHPHDDHVGGGMAILREFKIDTLFVSHDLKGNQFLKEIHKEATRQNIKIRLSLKGTRISLSELILDCLHPLPVDYSNINNYSSVWSFTLGKTGFLFLADLESDESDHLPFPQYTFVRSGHHGSYTATNESLLHRLSPKLFAISCGQNNSFGHPSRAVTDLLFLKKVPFFRTDRCGTKVLSSDGLTLRWVH